MRQALSLLGGMALLAALSLWNDLTWDAAAYFGLPPSAPQPLQGVLFVLRFLAIMAVILLGLGAGAAQSGKAGKRVDQETSWKPGF